MGADLHCHTKLSNSSMGIDDLLVLASKRGVDTLAITDRDCQAGNVRAAIIGKRKESTDKKTSLNEVLRELSIEN